MPKRLVPVTRSFYLCPHSPDMLCCICFLLLFHNFLQLSKPSISWYITYTFRYTMETAPMLMFCVIFDMVQKNDVTLNFDVTEFTLYTITEKKYDSHNWGYLVYLRLSSLFDFQYMMLMFNNPWVNKSNEEWTSLKIENYKPRLQKSFLSLMKDNQRDQRTS